MLLQRLAQSAAQLEGPNMAPGSKLDLRAYTGSTGHLQLQGLKSGLRPPRLTMRKVREYTYCRSPLVFSTPSYKHDALEVPYSGAKRGALAKCSLRLIVGVVVVVAVVVVVVVEVFGFLRIERRITKQLQCLGTHISPAVSVGTHILWASVSLWLSLAPA